MVLLSKLKELLSVKNNKIDINKVTCSDGSTVDICCVCSPFDMSKIQRIDNNFYILTLENVNIAIENIISLNKILIQVSDLCDCISAEEIKPEDLIFDKNIENGFRRNICVSFSPNTKTGKNPKYRTILHFVKNDKLFGDLFFREDGKIGKSRIIIWQDKKCYVVNAEAKDQNLIVKSIYFDNCGVKEKIYPCN